MNNFVKKRLTEIACSEDVNRFFFLGAFDWLNRHQFSRNIQGLQLADYRPSVVSGRGGPLYCGSAYEAYWSGE